MKEGKSGDSEDFRSANRSGAHMLMCPVNAEAATVSGLAR